MSETEKPRSGLGWPAALAILGVAAIAIAAIFLHFNNPIREVGRVAESWSQLFKPTVNVQTIIYTSFAKLTNEAKLVVLSATMDVEVLKTSEKKYFGERLDLGTTVVRLRAKDNKAQYYVPLGTLGPKAFTLDETGKRVVVKVPPPKVDHGIVEVQSDPSKIEVEMKTGWARLSSFSGAMLLEQAQSDLRLAVLQNAHSEFYVSKARESARDRLQQLLQPLAESLNPGVKLEIEFEEKVPKLKQP